MASVAASLNGSAASSGPRSYSTRQQQYLCLQQQQQGCQHVADPMPAARPRALTRRQQLLSGAALAVAAAAPPPGCGASGILQFPINQLNNTYFLVRAGQSEAEAQGFVLTNPVAKTAQSVGLSREGRRQVAQGTYRQLRELGLDEACWIWPSITQNAYQTAEILAEQLYVGRSRIVPEFSFLDARGVGELERLPVGEVAAALAAGDSLAPTWRPAPNVDGTLHESSADVLVRVRQLLSVLETQYLGQTVLLVSPDSDNLSVMQAAVLGVDLRGHHTLAFAPGEARRLQLSTAQREQPPSSLACPRPPQCLPLALLPSGSDIKLERGGSGASTPEASTPASLQTTPSGIRSPCSDAAPSPAGSPSPLRHTLQLAASQLQALRGSPGLNDGNPSASRSRILPQPTPAAGGPSTAQPHGALRGAAGAPFAAAAADVLALGDQAELVGAEAEVLREGLHAARRQLAALQRQLVAMQRQAARQQQLLATLLLEQECEAKLARSEAQAYRTAAKARTAAVDTLQSAVAMLQGERRSLQGRVRQLSASLAEACSRESALAAHDRQREHDAATLRALAAQLEGKAAAAQEAQAAAQAAVGLARRLGAAVDGLQRELEVAAGREAGLAADKRQLEERLAVGAAARAQLQGECEQLRVAAAQNESERAAMQQQAQEAGVEPARLQRELESQRSAASVLQQQHEQLQARVRAAEAEAGAAAGQLASACEQNALLAEQLARVQKQVDEAAGGQLARAELEDSLQLLAQDKAALQARLARAEADGDSLRRLVRMLKHGDSAAPSPMGGALAAGPLGDGSPAGGVTAASAVRRPKGRSAGGRQGWEVGAEVGDERRRGSDSGSSDEAEEQPRGAHAPGGAAARQGPGASGSEAGSDSLGGSGGRAARFLEEQVQSLTTALRRLQHQNRQLSAQLSATGGGTAGALAPAVAPPAAELRHEVSSLAAENAALRRQVEEAEGEAGRVQWQMQRWQAETRSLHEQVVEVVGVLSQAGLTPPQQPAPTAGSPALRSAGRPGHQESLGGQAAAPPRGPGPQPVPATPPSVSQQPPGGDASGGMLAALRQAMAALDDAEVAPGGGSLVWAEDAAVDGPQPRPSWAADSDGDSSVSDVFGDAPADRGSPLAAGPDGSPARPPADPPLERIALDIAALGQRNAALQRELDGFSAVAGSRRPLPALGAGTRGVELTQAAAGSHTLLPPTPDLSYS